MPSTGSSTQGTSISGAQDFEQHRLLRGLGDKGGGLDPHVWSEDILLGLCTKGTARRPAVRRPLPTSVDARHPTQRSFGNLPLCYTKKQRVEEGSHKRTLATLFSLGNTTISENLRITHGLLRLSLKFGARSLTTRDHLCE
eukprot:3991191-Amphidinium_carterae.1